MHVRFKSNPASVLLATDVAARGLDIAAIDHVIHYQIPRTADAYVHRNGRTARAMRKGFSMLMCAPDEQKVVKGLLRSLGRGVCALGYVMVETDNRHFE
jgi:ATP-dependent RNA helicase DDX24/MAK5